MNEPDPVDPSPAEACSRSPYDLNGTPPGFVAVPVELLDTVKKTAGEGRLSGTLRGPLQTAVAKNPADVMSILVLSVQQGLAGDSEVANAFADLAVTGRSMYAAFCAIAPTDAQLTAAVPGDPEGLAQQVAATLDRAYGAAAALRNDLQSRINQRAQFGYLAVSGEDDPPHRLVNCNLPSASNPPFAQFDIDVSVPSTPALPALNTRFIAAFSDWTSLQAKPGDIPPRRTVAREPDLSIPSGDKIVVYMHGHSSKAEEAGDLIPELVAAGIARGTPLTVISLDMPNFGYSDSFDHRTVFGTPSGYPASYPCVQFLEDFIVAFIQSLDAKYGNIANRVTALVGGSLGGNLGLRLSRRPSKQTFLQKIVSWSPACAWPSWAHMLPPPLQTVIDDSVLKTAKGTMNDGENFKSRADYFTSVYDVTPVPLVVPAQPQMWYRDDWKPCKDQYILESRWERWETYRPDFRRWHWRVAYEQMIYSFRDPDAGAAVPRYLDMTSAMLLASGQADDYIGANIFTWTRDLAGHMINTPGHGLFLKDTGHSIHNERPKALAQAILDLIQEDFTSPVDPEGNQFGEPCTWPEQTDPAQGEYSPGTPLLLHWVGPGRTDPGCGS